MPVSAGNRRSGVRGRKNILEFIGVEPQTIGLMVRGDRGSEARLYRVFYGTYPAPAVMCRHK
ncbi:MAG: hypothetical protein LBI14_02590 [Treponema sp.]|nr:hypothetical protein [Treponema sp.]